MKLPFFWSSKEEKSHWYFGLFLSRHELTGCLYEEEKGIIRISSSRQHPLVQGWDHIIEDADDLLAQLEEQQRIHVKEVIFFVYSSLLDLEKQEISKEYLEGMKRIAKELELKPLGYIECQEALATHIRVKEQSLMHALFVEIDEDAISTTIYKGERVVNRMRIERTAGLGEDMQTLFSRIHEQTMLPSRLLVYYPPSLHIESSALHAHQWPAEMFIQSPRLEMISPKILEHAASALFSQQLADQGKDVKTLVEKSKPMVVPESAIPFEEREKIQDTRPQAKEEAVAGFMMNGDVVGTKEKKSLRLPSLPRFALFGTLVSRITRLFSFHTSNKQVSMKRNRIFFIIPVIGIFLIGISVFLLAYSFHTATVKVFVPSQKISKIIRVTSDTNKTFFHMSTSSASLTQTITTTGSRDVGNKAKGDMTVYNRTFSETTIPAGTVVKTGALQYTTAQQVTISAASEASDFSIQPGKGTIQIIANAIGPDGNIDKGKRFSIGTFDESAAFGINDATISGGTKKTLRTVAAKDLEDLKKKTTELSKNQKFDDSSPLPTIAHIISQLTAVTLKNITFTKSVGDEANEVGLQASAVQTLYWYEEDKIKQNIESQLQGDIPDHFHLPSESITYQIQSVKQTNNTINLVLDTQASAVKEIDIAALTKRLPGKSSQAVQDMVKKEFALQGVEINIKSPIFFLDGLLPFFTSHILVKAEPL